MLVSEIIDRTTINHYYILLSHSAGVKSERGHIHDDKDFISYSYNINQNGKLRENDAFIYWLPQNSSKDKKFRIFGGGVIKEIVGPDSEGNMKALIHKGFKLNTPIVQGEPYIENFKWEKRKHEPNGSWAHFKSIYGIESIEESDFWRLIDGLQCLDVAEADCVDDEIVKEIADEVNYAEGQYYYLKHLARERNKKLVEKAKLKFKKDHQNELFCEACGFNFKKVYGELGNDFIEAHHLKPVSKMKKNDRTYIKDLIMVCSNCHRMIHRMDHIPNREEIIELIDK